MLEFAIAVLVICIILIVVMVKTVPADQRWVVERLGKFREVWEPGMHFAIPFVDRIARKVPTPEQIFDVPPSPGITKDNVQVMADSFLFFRIMDPRLFAYGVSDVRSSLANLSVSSLRNIIGTMDLEACLSSRDVINQQMTQVMDKATDPWGIKVIRVEIKTFTPPRDIQESMERQMKAEREKRETVIRAEADKQAAITSAEKEKAVAILNAQAAKESAALKAEANRIAIVQSAEAEKEAMLLRAEAAKEAEIKKAEAQAESIRIVESARAEGLRAINAAAPTEAALRLKAYDAFAQAANGQATKIIVPSDMQGIVGMASAVKDVLSHK